jgi:hypothetical protein
MNLKLFIGIGVALILAGCSSASSLLNSKSNLPQAERVPVGNNLAMPPDLQLAQPGRTYSGYQSNGYVQPIAQPVEHPASQVAGFIDPQAPAGQRVADLGPQNIYDNQVVNQAFPGDYYAKYGISRFKKNGKLKTQDELKHELAAMVLAKKREQNPAYGTIGNFGNMVSGKDDVIMHP